MTHTRTEMAAYIKDRSGCTRQSAEHFALLAVEWLLNAVATGERVELRGFGTFHTAERRERKSNLPNGGTIGAKNAVKFRPSEALKRLVGNRQRENENEN